MKKLNNKYIGIFIMLITLLTSTLNINVGASVGGNLKDEGQVTYEVNLKVDDTEVTDEPINLEDTSVLRYGIEINIDNDFNLNNDHTLEFDLSNLKNILKDLNIDDGRIKFTVKGEDGEIIVDAAQYTVEDGKLKIHFDKGTDLNDGTFKNRKGFVELIFDIEDSGEELFEEIVVPFTKEKNKTITIVRTNEKAKSISKTGYYNDEADEITWTIDVNTILDELTNVKVTDILPSNLKFEKAEIVNLKVTKNEITPIGNSNEIEPTENEDGNLVFDLGDLNRKARRIKITTSFGDDSTGEKTFENKVKLSATGIKPIESITSVSTNRLEVIKKSVDLGENNQIEWTIEYRGNGTDEKITDVLEISDGLEVYIVKDSVTINNKKHDNIEISQNKNEITFINIPSENKTHTIKYITETFYSGVSSKRFGIKNTAKYGNNLDSASIDVDKESVLHKEQSKVYQENDKTYIDWTIEINRNNECWDNVVLKESIPEGFKFISLVINKEEIKPKNSAAKPLEFDIEKVSKKTEITVKTELVNPEKLDSVDEVYNKVTVEWNLCGSGVGIGDGNKFSQDFVARIKKEELNHRLSKKNIGLDYKNQTASWEVNYLTYTHEITNEFKLTDYVLTNKDHYRSHTFDKDSFKVIINANEYTLVTGEHVTATNGNGTIKYSLVISNSGKEYKLTIHELDSKDHANKLNLTYRTSFKLNEMENSKSNIKHKLKNEVEIDNNNKKLKVTAEKKLSYNVSKNGNKIVKQNKHDLKTYDWTLYLNYKGKVINCSNAISDELSEGHVYVKDSIKLYYAELDKTGKLNKQLYSGELDKGAQGVYEITFGENNGKETMTIVFKSDLLKPIIVEYQTKAKGIAKDKYSNSVSYNEMTYTNTIGRDNHDQFLDKKLLNDRNGRVVEGDVLKWSIKVNKSLSDIENFVLEDELVDGLILIQETIKVSNKEGDITDHFTITKDDNMFKISKDELSEEVLIEYETIVMGSNVDPIKNTARLSGDGVKKDFSTKEYEVLSRGQAGGSADISTLKLKVTKVDSNGDKIVIPTKFKFITKTVVNEKEHTDEEFIETVDGIAEINFIENRFSKYFIQEETPPNGFVKLEEPRPIIISEFEEEELEITFENDYKLTEFTVIKEWINGKERPTITAVLYANGVEIDEIDLNVDNDWTHTWEELNKTDINGVDIEYSVKEKETVEGYESSVDGGVITNTYTIPKTSKKVEKQWNGGPEDNRPEITVHLLKDGEKYESIVLNGVEDDWTYIWEDLDETHDDGTMIEYSVREDKVANYDRLYDGDVIINDYVSPKTEVSVAKLWVGGKDRPEIEVQLLRDGEPLEEIEPITLDGSEEEAWTHTWVDLDETDKQGVPYVYTVEEITELEIYVTTYSEDTLTITNTYESPLRDVEVTKTWDGGSDEDKAQDIELQLLRNGEAYGETVTLVAGETSYVWEALEVTDIDGVDYVYTVEEVNVPENYEVDYDGLHITNTYISPLTSKSVKKIWVDGPEKTPVEVQLYRNGDKFGEVITLDGTEEDAWTHTWDKLDLNDHDGKAYIYSVEEVNVDSAYGVEYTQDEDTFIITNTYASPTTSVIAHKSWVNGSKDKPDITLQLLRDGEAYGDAVVLKSGEYRHIWLDLEVTDEKGVEYEYSVVELDVPENYEATYDGMHITNTFISPKTELTVEKVWVDAPRKKPTIEVQLFRNGEAFGAPITLENGETSYTWEALDQMDEEGVEYTYTVDEVDVPNGYTKDVHGSIITNTYTKEKLPSTGSVNLATIALASLAVSGLFFGISRKRKED